MARDPSDCSRVESHMRNTASSKIIFAEILGVEQLSCPIYMLVITKQEHASCPSPPGVK